MSEAYLQLPLVDQSQILRALAPRLGRSALVLEKDVWLCWVLQTLFSMPQRLPMAFKGGTSLSKVFNAIARFSEDVDITLDYRGLADGCDPFAPNRSRHQLKKLSTALKAYVREHVSQQLKPYFQQQLADAFGAEHCWVTVSTDGEQMRIHYPTALAAAGGYIGNSVLLEFGGRNISEPQQMHVVQPDISVHLPALTFPWPRSAYFHRYAPSGKRRR